MHQLTLAEALVWLESVARAEGADVPFWLVAQDRRQELLVVPVGTLRLDASGGPAVVLVVGHGVEVEEGEQDGARPHHATGE